MIDLYYWPTPNGIKVTMALEEMALEYNVHKIDIGKGDQFEPEFLKIAPNNRMPAIVDHDARDDSNGGPLSIFESGAILMYLAEKTGKFLPTDIHARYEVMQWTFWQMGGLGPIAGQAGHFLFYQKGQSEYAENRFRNELNRLYGVLNRQLEDREFIAGDYSIADMLSWPWIRGHDRHEQNIDDFPALKEWYKRLGERPAVQRAVEVGADWMDRSKPMSEEQKKLLFGQTAEVVK